MRARKCTAPGCKRNVLARGFCHTHYVKARRLGQLPYGNRPAGHAPRYDAAKLTPNMEKALQILARGQATCANLGAKLTGHRSFNHEGSGTLGALARRKLIRRTFDGRLWQWSLTSLGRKTA